MNLNSEFLFSNRSLVFRAGTLKILVRKVNRVDLIRLLLQKQSDLSLPRVSSISSQLLMELTKGC